MGKPRRKAPTFDAAPPAAIDPAAEKRAKKKAKKAKTKRAAALLEDEDAKSDAGSEAGERLLARREGCGDGGVRVRSRHALRRLRGQGDGIENPKVRGRDVGVVARAGRPNPRTRLRFSGSPARFRFADPSRGTLRGARRHLYIFEFYVGFAALNLSHVAKWSAPRQARQQPRDWRRLLFFSSVSPRDSTSSWTASATGTPRTSAW